MWNHDEAMIIVRVMLIKHSKESLKLDLLLISMRLLYVSKETFFRFCCSRIPSLQFKL